MSPNERVMAIFNGNQPDQVPWFGDLDYWATTLICKGEKPEDFKISDDYIKWHEDLGVGFYLQGFQPFKVTYENCKVKEWQEGDNRYRQIETPKGTLQECWQWIPTAFTIGPTEHFVKSAADLPAYQYMYENMRYESDNTIADIRERQIGDAGIQVGYLPKSPLMQLLALDSNIITFMELYMSATDQLESVIDAIRISHDIAAQIAVDCPADVLLIPENLSAEVVGPHLFEQYMKDYQVHWNRKIKEAGKFPFIHMDGTLKGLLREECATGFSFIEAMTPAPVGDLAIEEWEGYCDNDQTIFWGGIPGVYFTGLVSDDEFDDHIRRVLAVMTSKPRYVLGIADQAPPDTLEYRVRRVAELVQKYGQYN